MAIRPTRQLLVRLPDDLARRLERQVPARGRSAFIQQLLEHALAPEGRDDDSLYQTALEVEQDEGLAAEMAEWDGTVADGWERPSILWRPRLQVKRRPIADMEYTSTVPSRSESRPVSDDPADKRRQAAVQPPSMDRLAPVIWPAESEAI